MQLNITLRFGIYTVTMTTHSEVTAALSHLFLSIATAAEAGEGTGGFRDIHQTDRKNFSDTKLR